MSDEFSIRLDLIPGQPTTINYFGKEFTLGPNPGDKTEFTFELDGQQVPCTAVRLEGGGVRFE